VAGTLVFTADVDHEDHQVKAVKEAMDELLRHDVLVGITQESNGRAAEGSVAATNAELLFIHTNGSPINGIPARPVIEAAIEHEKEQISSLIKAAADAATSGDKAGVKAALERAGTQGANIARGWFTNPANHWKALKPKTVKRKGSSRPLIDTGEMRKSITYKITRI